MGPMGNIHAVQIHPTRRCNLRCLHCYSSSSPSATEALHIDTLRTALDDLAEENYNWASFSGGEPLVYTPLPTALAHAKRVGMNTAVVSNGMLLTPRRLDLIEEHTDLLVISLDGKPRSHNRIRNSDKAFDTMAAKLPELQARGIRFGFLFTLTQHNLDELPWVIEFAVNVGARLVQIHPLEYFGNATTQLAGSAGFDDLLHHRRQCAGCNRGRACLVDRGETQTDARGADGPAGRPGSYQRVAAATGKLLSG